MLQIVQQHSCTKLCLESMQRNVKIEEVFIQIRNYITPNKNSEREKERQRDRER